MFLIHTLLIIMILFSLVYLFSIVRLSLYLVIGLYRVCLANYWANDKGCVDMVSRQYLSADMPYILGHVVDRRSDNPIESSVVHSPNVGTVERGYASETSFVLMLASCNAPYD